MVLSALPLGLLMDDTQAYIRAWTVKGVTLFQPLEKVATAPGKTVNSSLHLLKWPSGLVCQTTWKKKKKRGVCRSFLVSVNLFLRTSGDILLVV